MNGNVFLKQLTVILYIILSIHLSALYFFLYWSFWWMDIVVHTLAGFWVGGMSLWWYVFIFSKKSVYSHTSLCIAALVCVVAIGLLWEFFEFGLDTFIVVQKNDIVDTISDIGSDIAGGLIACLYAIRRIV